MDNRTTIFLIGIGSFIFGFLLALFQLRMKRLNWLTSWVAAKFLQGAGSLLLCFYGNSVENLMNITTNSLLLLGCTYEGWAIFYITGRIVSRRLRLLVALGIVSACIVNSYIDSSRVNEIFILHAIIYVLSGWALLSNNSEKSILRLMLGISFMLLASVFFMLSLSFFPVSGQYSIVNFIFQNYLVIVFCNVLIGGFCLLLIVKEISDRELQIAQETLNKSEAQYRRIVETAIEGVLTLDSKTRITFVNHQMAAMLGYSIAEMIGQKYDRFLMEDQLDENSAQMRNRAQGQDAVYERCFKKKDGEAHWILVSAKAIIDAEGKFAGSFAMFTDIDKRKKAEAALAESNRKLEALSKTDGLTGIANRRHFDDALAKEVARHSRFGAELSLILLDVDHFKAFNDNYGHVMGDECLRQVGQVLTACCGRGSDLSARYGGEEFVCILPETNVNGAATVAERIRQGVLASAIPHRGSSAAAFVTVSLGVATVKCDADSETAMADLVALADKMLYKAKSTGRNRVECIFRP